MGAVMHVFLLLQLLILLVVANGAAVGAKKLLGATFARPLDGGASLSMADRYGPHENHQRHPGVRVGDVHLCGAYRTWMGGWSSGRDLCDGRRPLF